jgi:hypothetical protein
MSGLPPGISPVPQRPTAPRAAPTPVKAPIGPAVVTNYYGTHPNVFLYLIIGFLSLVLAGFVVNDLALWGRDRDDPIPTPAPHPKPHPIKGKLWVTTVYDVNEPGQDFGQLEADADLSEGLNKINGRWRNLPSTSANVAKFGYDEPVKKFGLPTLVITSEDGKKVKAMKCPLTAKEILKEVEDFRMGKTSDDE